MADDRAALARLSGELLFPGDFLQEVWLLLRDRGQVVFQGPPGTGKTYVAKKLAESLAGSDGAVRVVQFHPSYAYEDFVQGLRPVVRDGRPGFELRDGPLVQLAKEARAAPEARSFLIVDEINRGNLAKVFGELYFLLEYRGDEIRLQYSDEPFSLPKNLYVVGTMNTADRSIALVDLALRRRFHFVDFRPGQAPVHGLLGRWLARNAPGMAWVARLVDRANEELADHHASIGPSYFMRERLDLGWVRRIWKHSVMPYVAEHLHGEPDRIEAFDFDRLLEEIGVDRDQLGDEGEQTEAGDQPNIDLEQELLKKAARLGADDLLKEVVRDLGADDLWPIWKKTRVTFYYDGDPMGVGRRRGPLSVASESGGQRSTHTTAHSVRLDRDGVRVVFFPIAVYLCREQFDEVSHLLGFTRRAPQNTRYAGDVKEEWICPLDAASWKEKRETLLGLVTAVRDAWERAHSTNDGHAGDGDANDGDEAVASEASDTPG